MDAVGVEAFDESVYRALLEHGVAAPSQLAVELGSSTERVCRALVRLHEQGLVGRLSGSRRRYASIDPRPAIDALLQAQATRLETLRATAAELSALFEQGGGTTSAPEVEIITGGQALGQWFIRLQQQARVQVRTLDRPPYALTTDNPVEETAIGRGLTYRAVYAPEALEWPGVLADIHRLVEHGEQARVLPGVRVKVAIADDSLALMPLSLDFSDIRAALIRPCALLDLLVDHWEMCWANAAPLFADDRTAPNHGSIGGSRKGGRGKDARTLEPSGEDRLLLALLTAGSKDEAIARQLGWSVRTMRRRMSQLMSDLDASNRFQAGASAARRGWV